MSSWLCWAVRSAVLGKTAPMGKAYFCTPACRKNSIMINLLREVLDKDVNSEIGRIILLPIFTPPLLCATWMSATSRFWFSNSVLALIWQLVVVAVKIVEAMFAVASDVQRDDILGWVPHHCHLVLLGRVQCCRWASMHQWARRASAHQRAGRTRS